MLLSILFLFGTALATDNAKVTSVSEVQILNPGQQQEIAIQLKLTQGFHAYQDQFRILNLRPATFKAGQIRVKPETEFYDKFSKKNRLGFADTGTVSIILEASDEMNAKPLKEIQFDLRYQICSEKICYLPKSLPVVVKVLNKNEFSSMAEPNVQQGPSLSDEFRNSLESNLLLAFALVFLAGILTSFTPCIFPMLPITISILGYHANKGNRGHNIIRAISYVLGIALTYSILGVIAALTGQLFGSALTNKYVLAALCALFVLMALGMWDAFEVQVPAFIRNRFATAKGHGLGGAFVMGLVAGVVASPCVGPVLISILSFVSTTRNAFLGFSLLFTFAMGLGLIFIVIGAFSHVLHLLPKSGPWMNFIKFILGAGMWTAALYYAQFLMAQRWWILIIAISFIVLSIWKGAFAFHKKNYIRQSLLLALFVFSSSVCLLTFAKPEYLNPAFVISSHLAKENSAKSLWVKYSDQALQEAIDEGKPVLLDFYADWCGACHELEEKTYTQPEFFELSQQFKLIKFDATNDTPEIQEILKKYQVQGLPTVMFINRKGDLLKNLTFTQFIEWKDLKPLMQESLK